MVGNEEGGVEDDIHVVAIQQAGWVVEGSQRVVMRWPEAG